MRLQQHEIEMILCSAREVYGEGTSVYLFGFHTDDTQKGGDINLLVRTDSEDKKGVLARIRFQACLKTLLGGRKIDVVPDANEWIYVRELRNEISHDYLYWSQMPSPSSMICSLKSPICAVCMMESRGGWWSTMLLL